MFALSRNSAAAAAGTALAAALALASSAPASAGVSSARIGDSGAGPGYGTFCEYPVTARADAAGYVVFADWLDGEGRQDPAAFPTPVAAAAPRQEVTALWRPQVQGKHTIYAYQGTSGAHVKLHVTVVRGMHLGSACAALPF